MLITQGLTRPLYGSEGMLGNQDKMVEKSKFFMRIQSHLILDKSLKNVTNELKETTH